MLAKDKIFRRSNMANKLKLKPLGGRVIIEPIEQEEITAGGIILPETAKEKPQGKAKFLAVVRVIAMNKKANAFPWT